MLHVTPVTMSFFGYHLLPLMMPLALSYLTLAIWLIAKGFCEVMA